MRAGLVLLIAAAHVALWAWLDQALRPHRASGSPTAAIAWLDLKALPPTAQQGRAQEPGRPMRPRAATPTATAPVRGSSQVSSQVTTLPVATGAADATLPPAALSEPAVAAPAPQQAVASAANTPVAQPSLLESAGTRRAAAAAAAKPSVGELGRLATGQAQPLSRQEQLAHSVGRAAVGDCLKGEFAGAGMGILSVPFFAWAELAGHCRR